MHHRSRVASKSVTEGSKQAQPRKSCSTCSHIALFVFLKYDNSEKETLELRNCGNEEGKVGEFSRGTQRGAAAGLSHQAGFKLHRGGQKKQKKKVESADLMWQQLPQ